MADECKRNFASDQPVEYLGNVELVYSGKLRRDAGRRAHEVAVIPIISSR
jgi:hypothetical protein